MEKIRLDVSQITPGMRLAEPVINASGITLIPSGIRLTPMFLARIKKWSIPFLDVLIEDKPPDSESTSDSARREAAAKSGRWARRGTSPGRLREQEPALTAEQEQFARGVATEVSRAYANLRDNPLMMLLRASTIRRLVMAGADAPINILRRGPQSTVPLPEESS